MQVWGKNPTMCHQILETVTGKLTVPPPLGDGCIMIWSGDAGSSEGGNLMKYDVITISSALCPQIFRVLHQEPLWQIWGATGQQGWCLLPQECRCPELGEGVSDMVGECAWTKLAKSQKDGALVWVRLEEHSGVRIPKSSLPLPLNSKPSLRPLLTFPNNSPSSCLWGNTEVSEGLTSHPGSREMISWVSSRLTDWRGFFCSWVCYVFWLPISLPLVWDGEGWMGLMGTRLART